MRRQQLAAAGRLRFPENGRYKARLRLLDGTLYKGEGEVTFIDSQVQPSTGVIKARAVFANADGHIMPGQYVRLYMEGDVLKNAVLIPQKCVVLTQKGSLVMGLDKDNKVYAIPVTLSVAVGDRYLVDSGLKGGERIIRPGPEPRCACRSLPPNSSRLRLPPLKSRYIWPLPLSRISFCAGRSFRPSFPS